MESSFLQELAKLLEKSAPTKEEVAKGVQKFEYLLNGGSTQPIFGQIPNLNEFGSLLREVIPDKYPKEILDKSDLKELFQMLE